MIASKSAQTPSGWRPPQGGFALIISIGLMTLLVLLVIGFSALVRVESSATTQQLRLQEARQNAYLGAMVAVGELQKQLGPDQRATANADLMDDDTTHPLWTGVFRTIDLENPTLSREGVFDWATDSARIEWLFSRDVDSSVNLRADLEGNDDWVRLARYRFSDQDDIEAYAAKLEIPSEENETGRFAWWASDESRKARIDPEPEQPDLLTNEQWERVNFTSSQRVDFSVPTDSNNLSPASLPADLFKLNQLPLVAPDIETELLDLQPSITLHSESVPVDVTQGRLKQDLTAYLAGLDATISDSTPIVRAHGADGDYAGPPLAVRPDANDIPRFGLLKDWADLATGSRTPRAMNPSNGRQHFAPKLMRIGLWYRPGLDYGAQLTPPNPPTDPDGTYAPAGLTWRFLPAILIWNPYDHRIAASDYLIQITGDVKFMLRDLWHLRDAGSNQMRLSENQTSSDGGGPGQVYIARDVANPGVPVQSWSLYDFLEEDSDDVHSLDGSNTIRWLNFVARDLELQPGEVRILMPEHERPYNNQPASFYFNPANRNAGNTLLPDVFQFNGYIVQTGLNVYRSGDLDRGPPPDPLYAFFWPRRSTGSDPNEQVEMRFRLWALDAPDGPEIVQDAVNFNTSSHQAGRVSTTMDVLGSRFPLPDLPSTHPQFWWQRGYGGTTPQGSRILFAYEVRGTDEFVDYAPRHFRSFSTHFIGIGGSYDPRYLSSFNLFSPSMGSSLRDVGVFQDMGASMVYSGGIPGWRVDTGAWPTIENRYGNYGSPTIMHVHSADRFTDPASHDHIVNYLLPEGSPLTSIAQLQNASLASHLWQPQRAVGNSLPPPFTRRNVSFDEDTEGQTSTSRSTTSRSRGAIDANNALLDVTYALNSSLWDRFYLSTIPYGDSGFSFSEDVPLTLARNRIVASMDGSVPALAELEADTRAFEESAANVRVRGGFNVNSTSVEAWKLLLTSTFNRSVDPIDGGSSNEDQRFPIPRTPRPYFSEASGGTAFSPEDFNAIKSLGENEIQRLAEEIVEEIRIRGPFLSLADFVNRRLVAHPDQRGLSGAIQAAIDRVSREEGLINHEFYEKLPDMTTKTVSPDSFHPHNTAGIFTDNLNERVESYFGGLALDTQTSSYRGGPRYLMQADVLGIIGSVLQVRGDTFVVRAYGEAGSSLGGNRATRAHVELTVQRVAEPALANAVSTITEPGALGRLFVVTGMRWLSEEEVEASNGAM